MNSMEKMLSKLSDLLKGNTPESMNKILNEFGVPKDDVLKKLNNLDEKEIISKINNTEILEKINNISPEELEKLKNMSNNKQELNDLYKKVIDSKEDN